MDEKIEFLTDLEKKIASVNPEEFRKTKLKHDTPPSVQTNHDNLKEKEEEKNIKNSKHILTKDLTHKISLKKLKIFVFNFLNKFDIETALFFITFCISVLAIVATIFYEQKLYSIVALFMQTILVTVFFLSLNMEEMKQN